MTSKLKELRLQKNLTLKKLSDALKKEGTNISADSLAKYERGERKPKMDKLIQLANFFNVSVPELQGYKNKDITASKFEKLVKERPNDDYTKSIVTESIRQGNNAINEEKNKLYKQLENKIDNLDMLKLQIVVMFANFLKNIDSDNDDLVNEIYIAIGIINNLAINNFDNDEKTEAISELKKITNTIISYISTNKD